MFLLYLDASGTADICDVNSKHYVLAGVCLPDRNWFAIANKLDALKQRYRCGDADFELHVKQFAVSIHEQDEIPDFESMSRLERRKAVLAIRQQKMVGESRDSARAKRYKDSDPFIHLTRRERSQLLEDAVELLANHNQIQLFAEAISKGHERVVQTQIEPVAQAFEQVISRFDKFLQKKDDAQRVFNPQSKGSHLGMLILDNDAKTEKTVWKAFLDFRKHGHSFGQLRQIVDVPFFASSQMVAGLQLADVCAYVIRRYLDKGAQAGSHEAILFERLFSKFDRDRQGKLHGIRHYVSAGSCSCMICRERGHA